jgi:hypothetical protein
VRAFNEMTNLIIGGAKGGVRSIGSGSSARGGASTSSSKHPQIWP